MLSTFSPSWLSYFVLLATLGQQAAAGVLAPRQGTCPTATSPAITAHAYSYTATSTYVPVVNNYERATSTSTSVQTFVARTFSTIIDPATSTRPIVTITPYTSTVTDTYTWPQTQTEWIFSPGYAPDSACSVSTITTRIPGSTSTITYTTSSVITSTSTSFHSVSTLRTSTTITSTVMVTRSVTTIELPPVTAAPAVTTTTEVIDPRETSTQWQLGCRSMLCAA